MKTYLFIVFSLLLLTTGGVTAQRVSPFVVATSGGFYSSSAGMLSFTTGEMTAVETYTSPVAILTQGFQQTFDIGTYITEHPNPNFAFGVYPNPTSGNFNLITETLIDEHISVRIADMLGRVILSKEFDQHASVNIESFDLSIAASGMYLIILTVHESNANAKYQFTSKIQVVR